MAVITMGDSNSGSTILMGNGWQDGSNSAMAISKNGVVHTSVGQKLVKSINS